MVFDRLRATVIVSPSGCLACRYSSPYLTSTYFCPPGISVDDEMNLTFDMSTISPCLFMEPLGRSRLFQDGASVTKSAQPRRQFAETVCLMGSRTNQPPNPKRSRLGSSDSCTRSAASAGCLPTDCVSRIESARSQAPENIVKGKYQRRTDMTAPLRCIAPNLGRFAVVSWKTDLMNVSSDFFNHEPYKPA